MGLRRPAEAPEPSEEGLHRSPQDLHRTTETPWASRGALQRSRRSVSGSSRTSYRTRDVLDRSTQDLQATTRSVEYSAEHPQRLPRSVPCSTPHPEPPEGAALGPAMRALRRFGGAVATKKVLSRLRKALGEIFGLEQDPFEPYRGNTGWRARFQARPDLPDGLAREAYED